jgi:IMP dehydrogenase
MEKQLPQALTFDDVLLLPAFSDFSRGDITLKTQVTKHLSIDIPFVSSPMDTVTESKLALAIADMGGIGIIHRNLSVEQQANEVAIVKKENRIVGAAVGASDGVEKRVEELVKGGVDVIVVDAAHGFAKQVIDTIKFIKEKYPHIEVIGGSIATADGAKALIGAGADGLRVGMGPGAICTTRIISGMGVPQISALFDIAPVAKEAGVPVIADGGIKYSGDMVKALAAGASAVMMGSFFASTEESPGEVRELKSNEVPSRFQSILNKSQEVYKFKTYRGMGSIGAMKKGAEVKSEDEFHGKSYKDRVLVAEGVEGLVPVKGSVKDVLDQAIGGIRSGFYYVGAKKIDELWKKAKFIQITHASLTESHPHDILITNPGENYK